jgi:predicted ATPase/class 3 adenylate cyclase
LGACNIDGEITMALPTGTVTFLFTDIEGSTRLADEHPRAMLEAVARHDALAARIIGQHNGVLVKSRGEGDSLFAVFARATDAVTAAGTLQQAFVAEPWPEGIPLRVRIAVHTGEAEERDGDYYGAAVNRCARLRAVGHGGQVLLSQTTYDIVRDALPSETNVLDCGQQQLRDLARPERVFQLLHPSLPGGFPLLKSLDVLPNNLPRQPSSFVGREREIRDIKALLSASCLLTITGAGGSGKTRLALQVAADVLDEYPDGVWFVDLAPVSDTALVPFAVAAALGVREEPQRPVAAALIEYLKPKTLLLILDNCEHVIDQCCQLADMLLQRCPSLKILATSREALAIPGEATYPVPALRLPDARHIPTPEGLTQFEAVRLFIERATAVQPRFAITRQNAPAVAQVCYQLDGIPLAIELAAARVRALPVEQIAQRLDDRFRLLTGGSRTALPRQQTLRATMDWSYDLLTDSERAVLRRLAVFAGGCSLSAAEAVCAGEPIEEWDVVNLLSQLVGKSLVGSECQTGEAWYRLLETIRQYGQSRLAEANESADTYQSLLEWCLALAERAEAEFHGAGQREWLTRLEQEHDNLRAALNWATENRPSEGLRLATMLWWFWVSRSHIAEGRSWLEGLLVRGGDVPVALRARALNWASLLAFLQGDFATVARQCTESESLARQGGDCGSQAFAFTGLALVAQYQGDCERAEALLENSVALARQVDDRWLLAFALNARGIHAQSGGEHERALGFYRESTELFREVGDRWFIAFPLAHLGNAARKRGDSAEATRFLVDSLSLSLAVGNRRAIVQGLEGLAAVFGDQCTSGAGERAARLYGAASALREALGTPHLPHTQAEYNACVLGVKSRLGEEPFAAAFAQGRAMSMEQAVEYALEEDV